MPLRAVVLDIEGTTSATSFVVGRLYPYSAERFAEWVGGHADDPDVARAVGQVRELIGDPAAGTGAVAAALSQWLAADRKITPLKTLQGKIWAHGFATGDLVSHFYPDVIPALRRWHAAGKALYVFSSGSVPAQRGWFGHSPAGNLLPLMSGFFDTENAGPKREAASYRRIAAEIRAAAAAGKPAGTGPGEPAAAGAGETAGSGPRPPEIVFLSDPAAELDAARDAGWQTVAVRRPGEPYDGEPADGHLIAASFAELDLSGDRPAVSGSPGPPGPPAAGPPARPSPGGSRSGR